MYKIIFQGILYKFIWAFMVFAFYRKIDIWLHPDCEYLMEEGIYRSGYLETIHEARSSEEARSSVIQSIQSEESEYEEVEEEKED